MIHKFLSILVLFSFIHLTNYASNNETCEEKTNYWQQIVNYDITVTLDDKNHLLNGQIVIDYTNNSPEELDFIYFHLWPNAFKNQSTAFAKQKLENGDTDFYYSLKKERGYIDQLNFKGNEEILKWELDETHIDICKVLLNKPLQTGETIQISTPFEVKIPESFSRLGHVEQSYQFTQWYPKPAVFDQTGWHPMPYLDQGEFYSEYGSFDVKITLPENYIVGATGDLQNEEELAWLNKKAKETAALTSFGSNTEFPESATTTKTLQYKQDRVHDFAWFADKRFHVLKSEVDLPHSDRTVTTWAMFTDTEADLWTKATEYVNKGVHFYSKHLGDYPYNQCTAVQSALSAGAGMEYPNITVIGISGTASSLERVIVHEVGHNWFYGQLGSNERDFAWMDEGFNTYYEVRYFKELYPGEEEGYSVGVDAIDKAFGLDNLDLNYLGYTFNARTNKDQGIEEKSQDFTNINYFISAYSKPGLAFEYLEKYLGQKEFDRVMQKYYQQFEFKHPQPQDVRTVFEEETGKYLDWFFDELMADNRKIDYKIAKLKKQFEKIGEKSYDQITLKNKGGNVRGPFKLTAYNDGKAVHSTWYDGFSGEMDVLFPSKKYDKLTIDPDKFIPEVNRRNNSYKTKGLFKKRPPLKFQFLGSLEDDSKEQVFYAPALGYNTYDKFMLGMAFYNSLLPRKKLEFALAPMFSFGAKTAVGTGEIAWNQYFNNGFLESAQLSLAGASFHQGNIKSRFDSIGSTVVSEDPYRWSKIAPKLRLQLREKYARTTVSKSLTLRHVNILKSGFEEGADTNFLYYTSPSSINTENYYVNEVQFDLNNRRKISPTNLRANVQQSKDFVKASLEADYKFNYKKSSKGIYVRAFAGGFLYDNMGIYKEDFKFSLTGASGKRDYLYDHIYFGRNELNGVYVQQITNNQGGFKIPVNGRGGNDIGTTRDYLAALNLEVDLPMNWINASIYANIGFYQPETFEITLPNGSIETRTLQGINDKTLYEAGIALKVIPNVFEIYFPVGLSPDFSNSLDLNATKYWNRISFMLNFNRANPLKLARNLTF